MNITGRALRRLVVLWCACAATAAAAAQARPVVFDRTGIDITLPLQAALCCNTPGRNAPCPEVFRDFVFDVEDAALLRGTHVLLVPGGEFDAASELLRYCDNGSLPIELNDFFSRNPTTRRDVEEFLDRYICAEPDALRALYDTLLGTFSAYEAELAAQGIPATRLDYFAPEGPTRIGDRIGKLDLIARTINDLDNGTRRFVLIGHSFGGMNICDFLVELCNGHTPGMPEWKFFANTAVRAWSDAKKASLLQRIAAAVFLNSFLQGNLSNERRLEKRAAAEGLSDPDPVGYYVRQTLAQADNQSISTEDYISRDTVHLALITARYRTGYYLAGLNTPDGSYTSSVRDAVNEIAGRIPLIAVGCRVPRVAPCVRVGFNLLVYTSRKKWEAEHLPNDGAVNTAGGIFPHPRALYALFDRMDHGTLVMRPELSIVTSGSAYDQVPFIRTVLAIIAARISSAP